MAINFEEEERSRLWMFILPLAILLLALCLTAWAYLAKRSQLGKLEQEHSLTLLELQKYKNLYVDTYSSTRHKESVAERAGESLEECKVRATQLEDQLNALNLLQSTMEPEAPGAANSP